MASLTPYQEDILIRTALGEARGEGVEGMADVIQVILNRANSGQFPSDPAAVALQNKQFSTWNKGAGGNNPQQFSPNSRVYQSAKQALDAVVGGRPDPTGGALFYHTPSVSPYWANSVNTNGRIERNGHVFYPRTEAGVATALDVRRTPPTPASMAPLMASSRAVTSPTGGNGQLQSALNAYAVREGNRVTPASADQRVTARNRAPVPSTNDAARRAALQMTQSYVGQDRSPRVTQLPRLSAPSTTDAARRATLSIGANQSYAGQEALRRTAFNGDPGTPASGPVVATIPTRAQLPTLAAASVGRPPATKTVQTTTIRPGASSSANIASVRSEQAAARGPTTTARDVAMSYAGQDGARPRALPNQAQLNAATGFRVPQATEFQYNPNRVAPQRLASGAMPVDPRTVTQVPTIARAPVARLPAIAAAVAPSRVAPVPFQRPAQFAQQPVAVQRPVVAQPQRVAPVPMQRPAAQAPLMASAAPRPVSAAVAPIMAASVPTIYVRGSNTTQPQQSLYYRDPVAFGNAAVSLSGDNSVGNQREAAELRARMRSNGGGSDSGSPGSVQPRGTIW